MSDTLVDYHQLDAGLRAAHITVIQTDERERPRRRQPASRHKTAADQMTKISELIRVVLGLYTIPLFITRLASALCCSVLLHTLSQFCGRDTSIALE